MRHFRVIVAIGRADFLERIRRYSFLLTLLFAGFLGYAAATGTIALNLGDYRGVYTSAWVGALVAVVTTSFVSLVGFYIVKGAIDRDRQTGVGQILAATPLSTTSYALGKFLSNVAVLASMVLILALAAIVMQLFAGEDPHFQGVALLAPFVFIALPAIALTAALAVLFETVPGLRGGAGNIIWFFAWAMLGIGLPLVTGIHKLDPMGLVTVADSMMVGARANIPGFKNSFSLTIAHAPAKVVDTFRWQGVAWTSEQILLRAAWAGAAVVLVLLAATVFDRFDPSRSRAPSRRQRAHPAKANEAADLLPLGALGAILAPGAAVHLTPLANSDRTGAFGRLFAAELRLALKGLQWWWYAVALGLLVAQFAAPLDIARGPVLGTAWVWPVFVWSAMGTRESRFGTRPLLFSSPRLLVRQLPACWLTGVAVAAVAGAGAGSRLLLAQGFEGFAPWLAGTIFLPSFALALGVWSGTGKFYEGFLTALWYVGPMNHTPGLDFTGAASGPLSYRYALVYFALGAGLLAAAFFGRARQLRSPA